MPETPRTWTLSLCDARAGEVLDRYVYLALGVFGAISPTEAPVARDRRPAIIAREWQPEWRAGVEHYAVGQHVAFAITDHPPEPEPWEPDALLAFVPSTGHGVTVIPCMEVEGEWYALGDAIRVLCAMKGPIKLPVPFDLSDQMKSALDRIE